MSSERPVLTPRQLRAARALLGWSRATLAAKSGVPNPTLEKYEAGITSPMLVTVAKLRRAMEKAGVIFIDPDGEAGPGVRLREGRLEE